MFNVLHLLHIFISLSWLYVPDSSAPEQASAAKQASTRLVIMSARYELGVRRISVLWRDASATIVIL